MKNLFVITLVIGNLPAFVHAGCVINTNNLHFNQTAGTGKVESILTSKGYQVTSEKDAPADFQFEIRNYGNDEHKTLHMMVWNSYPKDIFNISVDYKTPSAIEDRIFERVHVVKLAKQIPACPRF